MVDKKFITKIQGKDFITHEGLLNEFHINGGEKIETHLIIHGEHGGIYVFKATVTGKKGIFEAHGDADDKNTSDMIRKHKIRMAETRAVNRALRFYNNIGMCSVDELSDDDRKKKEDPTDTITKAKQVINQVCAWKDCGAGLPDKIADFSKRHYGKLLCMKHQEEVAGVK